MRETLFIRDINTILNSIVDPISFQAANSEIKKILANNFLSDISIASELDLIFKTLNEQYYQHIVPTLSGHLSQIFQLLSHIEPNQANQTYKKLVRIYSDYAESGENPTQLVDLCSHLCIFYQENTPLHKIKRTIALRLSEFVLHPEHGID